jgi:hypothetical protein
MEKLREAILLDCEETLHNRKNKFSKGEECGCHNNLHVLLRVLKEKPEETEFWFNTLEIHLRDKMCKHIWSRERMNEAAWEYIDSKEK